MILKNPAPRWGHVSEKSQDSLLAAPFDMGRLEVAGGPVAITGGLWTKSVWESANFNVSRTGTLVHFAGGIVGANRQFFWLLPDGSIEPWSDERRAIHGDLAVSPDGHRFSVSIVQPSGFVEIWGSEFDRPNLKRLVSLPAKDCSHGVWNHDGSRLAFTVRGNRGVDGIYIQEANDAGRPRQVVENESPNDELYPRSFSPDGSWLLAQRNSDAKSDLVLIEADWAGEGPWKYRTLLQNSFGGTFSRDGRWIEYGTRSSGPVEFFIRQFEENGKLGSAIPVPFADITSSGWTPQERPLQLWYAADEKYYTVEVRTEPTVTFSKPELNPGITELGPRSAAGKLLPDGRGFGILKGDD
jgi:Tol biopolymer transport system component